MKQPSKELVDAFFDWYQKDPHSQNEDYYSEKIIRQVIDGLSREDFVEFFYQFARNGGKVQSGGYRTAPRFKNSIESKYEEFRKFVIEPFDEEFDEIKWLERVNKFSGFGQGLATIYLNRVNKERFAIVNEKSKDAVELFNVNVPVALEKKYKVIRDTERAIKERFPQFENYYQLDAMTHFLIGVDIGKKWAEELRGPKIRYWIFAPGERARMWDQYFREGIMGIGWSSLNWDLSNIKEEVELREVYDKAYGERATDQDFRQLSDFILKIQEGDLVFVKRGIREIVGYGEIASGYFFDSHQPEYCHLRRARWLKEGSWILPDGEKALPVKTLTEIKKRERIVSLLALIGGTNLPPEGAYHPTRDDFDNARRKLLRDGRKQMLIDNILDVMEDNLVETGRSLAKEWRSVTRNKIILWTQEN